METLHSHGSTFIFILSLCIPFLCVATDIITPTQPLAISQTLISSRQVFELGFFNLTNDKLYLGIWYHEIEPRTIVWVANRDAPVNPSFAKLTIGDDGNINLVDRSETAVWSSDQSVAATNNMVAQLLDSGNFVLRREDDDKPENYIWQSFDYPTDTLLPGMKLGLSRKTGINRIIRSWRADDDPASGDYSYRVNVNGFPELNFQKNGNIIYRSGPWNGRVFSGTPQMNGANIIRFEFHNTPDEVYYSYEMVNGSVYSRFLASSSGNLQRFVWTTNTKTWISYWSFPRDVCDTYASCGPSGLCDMNIFPVCKCLKGFRPRDEYAWNLQNGSSGCVRSSEMDCGSDEFLPLKNIKLPESSKAIVDSTMNLSECRATCKANCSCTAYANMDITRGGAGCVYWVLDLIDMRQYSESDGGGQDLFVRVAASDLGQSPTTNISKHGSTNSNNVVKVIAITVGICAGLLITLLIILYQKRKNKRRLKKSIILGTGPQERIDGETKMDELDLPLFDFTTLAIATNNFSEANKLGQGGFGSVYQGMLPGGEVVAVKRLSRVSDQGIEELINEVRLIAKLQHRNLVRLLGCCIEVEEKLLIYEFVENKSLDIFLFEKEKSMELSWHLRLHIICGIARGLLYLHQDSRFKIIHRDLKASNVLLDNNMNPKISDFGMARIFGRDQNEAQTKKVVGTYGYMSPEYAMDGHFSTKSDVFSFGVLVLEIVSGQKNRGSYASNKQNLLGHTWTLWKEDKALELVDKSVRADFLEDEALRCIQIGLLCVQEHAEDRPSMSKALLMLNSAAIELPQPKYPGFFIRKRHVENEFSRKEDDSSTVNNVTITILDGR